MQINVQVGGQQARGQGTHHGAARAGLFPQRGQAQHGQHLPGLGGMGGGALLAGIESGEQGIHRPPSEGFCAKRFSAQTSAST